MIGIEARRPKLKQALGSPGFKSVPGAFSTSKLALSYSAADEQDYQDWANDEVAHPPSLKDGALVLLDPTLKTELLRLDLLDLRPLRRPEPFTFNGESIARQSILLSVGSMQLTDSR